MVRTGVNGVGVRRMRISAIPSALCRIWAGQDQAGGKGRKPNPIRFEFSFVENVGR